MHYTTRMFIPVVCTCHLSVKNNKSIFGVEGEADVYYSLDKLQYTIRMKAQKCCILGAVVRLDYHNITLSCYHIIKHYCG